MSQSPACERLRLHYLQHVPFEDAANVACWAEDRGHDVSRTRLYAGEPLPAHDAYDGLAIMGGPMNIYEDERYPWLRREKEFIAGAIQEGKAVLGVCLGAQLIADILGGRVTKNRQREIGWFPVQLTPAAATSPLFCLLPGLFVAFHWHGDTFSLPPGAMHAATSEACENQAFQYGDRVVGLQFHLDYAHASIEQMVRHCSDELTDSPFVQPADALLASPERTQETKRLLYCFLDGLFGDV